MPIHHTSSLLLDALYCEEEEEQEQEQWEEELEHQHCDCSRVIHDTDGFSVLSLPLDLLWEDDDQLTSLFSKQAEQREIQMRRSTTALAFDDGRPQAVAWMSKVAAHYGFTTLTALLAINYLDRFLCTFHFQRDKPWMIQLVAVTCLSLAAKVEEIQVPLLLDLQLQVGDTKYVFEAKTIQRMELLVLSALQWRMHPVTPLSFIDHITRRLGLNTHLHWEFQRRCEHLLLAVISDSRSVGCLPSILATATMMHVIDGVEPCNSVHYKNQLLDILKMTQEEVSECYRVVVDVSGGSVKRRRWSDDDDDLTATSSPNGVVDGGIWSCESSNESWEWGPAFKRSRAQEPENAGPSGYLSWLARPS